MEESSAAVLNMQISALKGIGAKKSAALMKVGISSIADAISYFPRGYDDRRTIKRIADICDGEKVVFKAIVASKPLLRRINRRRSVFKAQLSDASGTLTGVWFNQPYLVKTLQPGKEFYFYGKAVKRFSFIEMYNPIFETASLLHERKITCGIVPLYPATAGLGQNTIREVIRQSLALITGYPEILPDWILKKYNFPYIGWSLRNIHFPVGGGDFETARKRLAFEELLVLQTGLLMIRRNLKSKTKTALFKKTPEIFEFIDKLPFKLTKSQIKVIKEIIDSMESTTCMNRLLQGDVGSGKTIVAVIALLKVVLSGYQGILMAPTEILANQHFNSIKELLLPLNINVVLLTGGLKASEKANALKSIFSGDARIIIGTHALLTENVEFENPGLVVTDEQHRFGVRQRAQLFGKGHNPDMLVMTATPIPRTLSMALFGDLDISVIDEMPPGRLPVKTYAVDECMRDRINDFIRKTISSGRQVYIVCPQIDYSEEGEVESAEEVAERISKNEFSDLRVGLMHGRMKPREKDAVMKEFAQGTIQILVSTTVIEVGVNIPNASLMIVENAERFGLAELHQLRGRVGRSVHQSYCILYNQGKSEIARERMDVLQKTSDGFVIAEKDLELRGPGDFFGIRQHGIPDLKAANLYKDIDLLKSAQEAASEILKSDPRLESDENLGILNAIKKKFNESDMIFTMG
jgi:ATP-dependent DNA helicase RecG